METPANPVRFSGVLSDSSTIRLPSKELASFRFVGPDDLGSLMPERLVRRVRASLHALAEGTVAELDNGVPVEGWFAPQT